ncbi:hypothetical protein [Pseudomonas aeruginosa]|uniref:hypothetical protein n=1 Tax=Pseudomonas aeruginosa TaxID=287 RepID=UPI000F546396|nr:hypothetical protein [Pseudomonas aeruginosa]
MQQRTALEQDVIDYVNTVQEIFEKQLELQKELRELFDLIAERYLLPSQDLNISEFGVNTNAIGYFASGDIRFASSGSRAGPGPSL